MKIDTLNSRIENAKTKILKKESTIEKKTAMIEKKREKIVKLGGNPDGDRFEQRDNDDVYWLMCEIENLNEDIERGKSEIEETKKSLAKYEAQLKGELEKEAVILHEIPESMRRMQTELVTEWDAWDKARRDKIIADKRELSYEDFSKRYSAYERYTFYYYTDEQIHDNNVQDAKMMILGLYYRVKEITGEVTDWSGIRCERGNMGAVLTGFVIGKEGRAEVETILAGGYNIQRLHVRTLVHAR